MIISRILIHFLRASAFGMPMAVVTAFTTPSRAFKSSASNFWVNISHCCSYYICYKLTVNHDLLNKQRSAILLPKKSRGIDNAGQRNNLD